MPDYYKLRIKEIADLPDKYPVWKVHWIGELSINFRTKEMMIEVCLVPFIHPEQLKNAEQHKFINNTNYEFGESQIIRIGVGQLPLVTVGTFFINGYPYKRPAFITEEFSFSVTEKNQKIISTGSSWGKWFREDEDSQGKVSIKQGFLYYIPALQYQVFFDSNAKPDPDKQPETESEFQTKKVTLNSKAYPSKCLVLDFLPDERPTVSLNQYPLHLWQWKIERKKNIKSNSIGDNQSTEDANIKNAAANNMAEVHGLIVPCMEMVRFYYTKSSQTCREMLFIGPDRKNRLFDAERTIKPFSALSEF